MEQREIKFRGKRIDNGEWAYGGGIYINIESKLGFIVVDGGTDEGARNYIIPETAGQFIGLTDKNEKDVYSGDIIQLYKYDNFKDYTFKYEKAVVWKDGAFHPDIKVVKFMYGSFVIWSDLIGDYRCFANLARPGEQFEVIGNIYQNPELIQLTQPA